MRRRGRMSAAVAAAAVCGLVMGAGGVGPANRSAEVTLDGAGRVVATAPHQPGDELPEIWRAFPIADRPIVVLQQFAQLDDFNGRDRTALLGANVRLDTHDWQAPASVEVRTPIGVRSVGAVTPEQALAAWRQASDPVAVADARRFSPISLTRVELGTMSLATDRGALAVPAWVFHANGGGSVRWPAVDPTVFWRGRAALASIDAVGASVDETGTILTVRLRAGGGDACTGTGKRRFTGSAELRESAALLTTRVTYAGPVAALPVGATCMRLLNASPADEVIVVLTEPLGGRVLLGPDGGAISVTLAA